MFISQEYLQCFSHAASPAWMSEQAVSYTKRAASPGNTRVHINMWFSLVSEKHQHSLNRNRKQRQHDKGMHCSIGALCITAEPASGIKSLPELEKSQKPNLEGVQPNIFKL